MNTDGTASVELVSFRSDTFKLSQLIAANLHEYKDEISDICESADKQLVIETKLGEINNQWNGMLFAERNL